MNLKKKSFGIFGLVTAIITVTGTIFGISNTTEAYADETAPTVKRALPKYPTLDSIYFAPDRYITAKAEVGVSLCETENIIEFNDSIIPGEFSEGTLYLVTYAIKNCDGVQKGSFCDQRMVGITIVDARPIEDADSVFIE